MTDDAKMFMNYRRLRHIKRCNNFPTNAGEDVAQHSYYVTLMVMAFTDEYNTWVDSTDAEHTIIDSELALRKALLHDTDESITGDIHWNIKHHSKAIHDEIIVATRDVMMLSYGNAETLDDYRVMADCCKDGIEGEIVDIADMLELGLYSWEECSLGNPYLKTMLDRCVKLVKEKPLYPVLVQASALFNSVMEIIESDYTVAEDLYILG